MPPVIDFQQHNEEVRQVWESYWAGKPIRVPVGNFTIGPRIWLLDPRLNTTGITFEQIFNDPETMFQVVLQYQDHFHHHIISDIEMGIPADGWEIGVEFCNVAEPASFGCKLHFPANQVVATRACYGGTAKYQLLERGVPDPFGGIYGRVKEYYEYFLERAQQYEFHGKPVRVAVPWVGVGTDGPLTVALDLVGEEILADMYLDPEYYHALMELIVESAIRRVRAWRDYFHLEPRPTHGGLADDAIQLISTDTYEEFVLPYHQRYLDALYDGGPHQMHLCGNVQRHLPMISRVLQVNHFDTGFPVNFHTLREEIGEEIHINGGVHVDILLHGTPDQVTAETRRILESGVTRGGRFIMKEANNLPPGVPLENLHAMYQATRTYGRYEGQ